MSVEALKSKVVGRMQACARRVEAMCEASRVRDATAAAGEAGESMGWDGVATTRGTREKRGNGRTFLLHAQRRAEHPGGTLLVADPSKTRIKLQVKLQWNKSGPSCWASDAVFADVSSSADLQQIFGQDSWQICCSAELQSKTEQLTST